MAFAQPPAGLLARPMNAPHEHPTDPARVALIFAAARAGCGVSVCAWCGGWLGLRRDLPPGAVSDGMCLAFAARADSELPPVVTAPQIFGSAAKEAHLPHPRPAATSL